MPERNLVDQKFSETDQKFPETGQLFFWATKKNEKKTGQLVHQETDQNHMDGTSVQGVESLWGDCRFIPEDWGSQ